MKITVNFFRLPLLPMLLLTAALLAAPVTRGQEYLKDVCRIEDGRMIFRIDLNWTMEQLRKVSGQFSLDSVLLDKIITGKADSMMLALGWQFRKINNRTAEISRLMAPEPPQNPAAVHVDVTAKPFLMDEKWFKTAGIAESDLASYGVNRFTRNDVFSYSDSLARFFLPGHADARQVYLSGSFNEWSTMGTPMTRIEKGWQAVMRLQPGKYAYKFIIDGRWTRDEFNKNREDDWNGGFNSFVWCYNYRFVLNGYPDARQVVVAGSFNGFSPKELQMSRTAAGWELPLYLRPGTHAYKFVADGKWITDPANPVVRPDGKGNFNSFMGIGDTTWFRLAGYTHVRTMMLAGSFNAWNNAELSMEKTATGWQFPYIMGPGNYEYKYIADGSWMTDTANPFVNGEGQFANSFLAVRPNHTFVLPGYPNARNVIVTGSFNGWNRSSYRMVRRNERWELPIRLAPGKNTYKFIVDGKWILDPGNELWEENEEGTGNSVLWLER
jgi:hypothetical protein